MDVETFFNDDSLNEGLKLLTVIPDVVIWI